MGGVVSAVTDAVSSVGDAVGNVASGVADAASTVVDQVVAPVAQAVDNTVQAAVNDPVGTIAKVATAVVAPELLPAVSAADALANGASPEQALVAAGTSYVASQAVSGLGSDVASSTGSQVAGAAVQGAAQGALSSALQGGDPLQGAVSGGLNAGVNTGADVAASNINQAANTPADASILNYQPPASVLGDQTPPADQSQTPPDSSTIGQVTPTDYSLTSATPVSNLPDTSQVATPSYSLANTAPDLTPGGLGLNPDASGQGLTMDSTIGNDPNQPSMGGGQGLTTQTDQGSVGASGLTATNSAPVLGDPSSFINNPDVTGTPVTTVPSDVYKVDVPNVNVAALTQSPLSSVLPKSSLTSQYPQSNIQEPKFMDVVNPMVTVGKTNIQGLQDTPLSQIDTTLNPIEIQTPKITASASPTQNMSDMYGLNPELYNLLMNRMGYADGGDVASAIENYNKASTQDLSQNAPRFISNLQPNFVRQEPKFLHPSGFPRQIARQQALQPAQLVQIKQAQTHGMLAKGGLPSKYEENAPKGHKPEFITGLTGYYAGGRGTGQSDDIPAMLHHGDYVVDAEAVSAFGDGSSKAGKDVLTHFMGQVPHRDGAEGEPVPAKIADGEFVLPASFVTSLGGGDNKRGAKMLDEMRQKLREHKRSAPLSKIPPKAKSPLDYLKGAKG